jgi:energy-converting hydrogenase Eha subunit A
VDEEKKDSNLEAGEDLEITQAAKELQQDLNQQAATLAPIIKGALDSQSALRSILGDRSNLKLMSDLINSSNMKVLQFFIDNAAASKAMRDSLSTISHMGLPAITAPRPITSSYTPRAIPPSPAVETVSALYAVRRELAGMASQSAAQVELTTASLGALKDVLDELKRSRESNRALVRLTVGLVVLTIGLLVGAALAIPEVRDQVGPAWNWLSSRF